MPGARSHRWSICPCSCSPTRTSASATRAGRRWTCPTTVRSTSTAHARGWQVRTIPALRCASLRQSIKLEHGETGLVQSLNNVDVSGYRHLWLQAWARVDYSDLSGGGTLGSEYPMMFRIKYEGPVEGSFIPWAIGLFYSNPDNRPIPPNTAVPVAAGRVEAVSSRPDGHRPVERPVSAAGVRGDGPGPLVRRPRRGNLPHRRVRSP